MSAVRHVALLRWRDAPSETTSLLGRLDTDRNGAVPQQRIDRPIEGAKADEAKLWAKWEAAAA